jgi:hypothetical protein
VQRALCKSDLLVNFLNAFGELDGFEKILKRIPKLNIFIQKLKAKKFNLYKYKENKIGKTKNKIQKIILDINNIKERRLKLLEDKT